MQARVGIARYFHSASLHFLTFIVCSAPQGPISNPGAVITAVEVEPQLGRSHLFSDCLLQPASHSLPIHQKLCLCCSSSAAWPHFSHLFFLQQQPSRNTTKDNNAFAVQYIFCLRFSYCRT